MVIRKVYEKYLRYLRFKLRFQIYDDQLLRESRKMQSFISSILITNILYRCNHGMIMLTSAHPTTPIS